MGRFNWFRIMLMASFGISGVELPCLFLELVHREYKVNRCRSVPSLICVFIKFSYQCCLSVILQATVFSSLREL
jgi:hypothetical protein